jgi:hypothetical protein
MQKIDFPVLYFGKNIAEKFGFLLLRAIFGGSS